MQRSTENEQICYVCGASSKEVHFYQNVSRFNGLDSRCADCRRAYDRQRKRKPSEAQRAAARRYYRRNREKILAKKAQRYLNDPEYRERAIERAKAWNWRHR